MSELYKKHRPKSTAGIIGQPAAVKVVDGLLARKGGPPHAILFFGPSGVGKTTFARIIAKELGCTDGDFVEINCAVCEAMQTVRDIEDKLPFAGMNVNGGVRCWLLDEFQALSRAAFTQQALLKMLEDPPSHIYFLLATTDPSKIIPTIRNRCTQIELKPVSNIDLGLLVTRVAKAEGVKLSKQVMEKIVELAAGSPRQALVMLDSVYKMTDEDDQLKVLPEIAESGDSYTLAKLVLPYNSSQPNWTKVKEQLNKMMETASPEDVRRCIVGVARGQMLRAGGDIGRAFFALQVFRDNYFDESKTALGYLVANCYEVVMWRPGKPH
jgi:DNA polymerase III gamma/tau subunit